MLMFVSCQTVPSNRYAGIPWTTIEKVQDHTVLLLWGSNRCTGVIDGEHVITAYHCGRGQTNSIPFVATVDNPQIFVNCEVVYTNAVDDVCILKPSVRLGDHPKLKRATSTHIGDTVFSVNHVHMHTYTYMVGYLANYSGQTDRLVCDIEAFKGSSGGGVFNARGEFLGIISSTQHWTAHSYIVPRQRIPKLQ